VVRPPGVVTSGVFAPRVGRPWVNPSNVEGFFNNCL
jgi:hypothetical protein